MMVKVVNQKIKLYYDRKMNTIICLPMVIPYRTRRSTENLILPAAIRKARYTVYMVEARRIIQAMRLRDATIFME